MIASANDILLFAMLIGGVTAFLLAVLFAWTVLAPLKALTRTAEALERGDLNQRVRVSGSGELALLGHVFNTMAASLQRGEQLRRSMVNDIAHELRTPLATIQANLDALQDGLMELRPGWIASLQQEVQICIEDTGEGIAASPLPYLFERFYRVDASRSRQTGGTGLGLAMVKQFVQAHGGQVTVESSPGCGARFCFTLPLTPSLLQAAGGK